MSEHDTSIGYIENRTIDEIEIGDSAELVRTLTAKDIDAFATVSGDINPAHVDPEFAEESIFHKVIAHGMWGGALISNVLGMQLPGPGTIYLDQTLKFLKPVGIGDTVTVRVTVAEKNSEKQRVVLDCTCVNDAGKTVITGQATVLAPAKKIRRPRVVMPELLLRRHGAVLEDLLSKAKSIPPLPTAIVHPCDATALEGALEARDLNLIDPILIGPRARIASVAEELDVSLDGLALIDTPHSHASAKIGVSIVREGKAHALMKGALHTDEIMEAVVDPATGLRSGRRMSHVYVMDVPAYAKPLIITDAAINISPDLKTKVDIVQNAIDLGIALGIEAPKVALLSAVETVTTRMPSTVEAAALCKMADRGQITGGVLDGPLALDNAVSMKAVASKGIASPVAGQADILVVPNVEAGNMLAKELMHLAGAEAAGIVLGAQVPIILTSRSDDSQTRIASAAIAALLSGAKHQPDAM
ncbi:MAG: bifunctional enoyl-CoA hydratase/phosphate acetyltransferase [Pseudomonadota bacterium]